MGSPHDKFRAKRSIAGRFKKGDIVTPKELQSLCGYTDAEVNDRLTDGTIELVAPRGAQPIQPGRSSGTGATVSTPSGPKSERQPEPLPVVYEESLEEVVPISDAAVSDPAPEPELLRADGEPTELGLAFLSVVVEFETARGIDIEQLTRVLAHRGYALTKTQVIQAFGEINEEAYIQPSSNIVATNGGPDKWQGSTTYGARWTLYKAAKLQAQRNNTPIPLAPPPPFEGIWEPHQCGFHIPPVQLKTPEQIRFLLACYEASTPAGFFDAAEAGAALGLKLPQAKQEIEQRLAELIKLNAATQQNYDLTATFARAGRRIALHILRSGYGVLPYLWTNPQTSTIYKIYREMKGGEIVPFNLREATPNERIWRQLEQRMIIERVGEDRAVFTHKGYECAQWQIEKKGREPKDDAKPTPHVEQPPQPTAAIAPPDLMNPVILIYEAAKRVGVVWWFVAVGAVLAVVFIVSTWHVPPQALILGGIGLLVGVVALVIATVLVASLKTPEGIRNLSLPVRVLVWSFLGILVLSGLFTFTSVFFDSPLPLKSQFFVVTTATAQEAERKKQDEETWGKKTLEVVARKNHSFDGWTFRVLTYTGTDADKPFEGYWIRVHKAGSVQYDGKEVTYRDHDDNFQGGSGYDIVHIKPKSPLEIVADGKKYRMTLVSQPVPIKRPFLMGSGDVWQPPDDGKFVFEIERVKQ